MLLSELVVKPSRNLSQFFDPLYTTYNLKKGNSTYYLLSWNLGGRGSKYPQFPGKNIYAGPVYLDSQLSGDRIIPGLTKGKKLIDFSDRKFGKPMRLLQEEQAYSYKCGKHLYPLKVIKSGNIITRLGYPVLPEGKDSIGEWRVWREYNRFKLKIFYNSEWLKERNIDITHEYLLNNIHICGVTFITK